MTEKRPAGLLFIFITLLIDVIGFGLIIPVLPDLLASFTGGSVSEAARWGGLLMFTYAAMQFFFSPIIGGLSDQFGRRKVILASLFAFSIDFLVCWWAPTLGWFFVARLISGITGATMTAAMAYIADVSEPEKRSQNFGLVGAAFGLGFIVGPLLGGVVSHHFGLRAPFLAAAGLAMANWLYGFFILPESLRAENRRTFDWKRANPIGTLKALAKYPVVLGLVAPLAFLYIAGHANQSTWTYITKEKFGWSPLMIAYSLAAVGAATALVQGGLTRVLIPKLGQKRSVMIGLSFYALGFTLFAFADQSWMMFAFIVPLALGGLAGPALQGLLSSQVPPNAQGELQGGLTSIISLTSIAGPLLMTNLFSFFTSEKSPVHFAGAPFLAAAVLCAASMGLAFFALKKKREA